MINDSSEATWFPVASFGMRCPVCPEEIPVGVLANITVDDEGRQELQLMPDMDELWSHTFTHDEPPPWSP